MHVVAGAQGSTKMSDRIGAVIVLRSIRSENNAIGDIATKYFQSVGSGCIWTEANNVQVEIVQVVIITTSIVNY